MSETGKFLKGKLLLDGGVLRGSFFHHTVVLVCEHNAEGAFGLVLNRAASNKVGEVLVADLPDRLRESPLFLGGPVQPTALSFLHADSFIPDANVFPKSQDVRRLRRLVARPAGNRNKTQGVAHVPRVARTRL